MVSVTAICDQARRLARRGAEAPLRLDLPPDERAAVTALGRSEPLAAAQGLLKLLADRPSTAALAGLAVALARLDEAATGSAILRRWVERAPPMVLRALERELWRSPDEAESLGLRQPPSPRPDEIPLYTRPALGLRARRPSDQQTLTALCGRLRELARLNDVDLTLVEGAEPSASTWVDLLWTSGPQERPYSVPLASEGDAPARVLTDLALGQHLWSTWTPDPGLLLEPMGRAMTLIAELQHALMMPLPPWYAQDPARLRRALFHHAPRELPTLLQTWEGTPARAAALVEASLSLLARGIEAEDSAAESPLVALEAALAALRHPWLLDAPTHRMAAARALSRAVRQRARHDPGGGYDVPLSALGAMLREAGDGGGARFSGGPLVVDHSAQTAPTPDQGPTGVETPVRLFRTLDLTWAVAEGRQAGVALRAVLNGVLPVGDA